MAIYSSSSQAIEDFTEAVRLEPQFSDAYKNRGLLYTALGMVEEAQRDIDKAVELGIDPNFLQEEIEKIKGEH